MSTKVKLGKFATRAKAKALVRQTPTPVPPPVRAPAHPPRPRAQVADAFKPIPKRAGAISAKQMDKYLDKLSKLRARNDHRVAQNAEDHLLRGFQAAHMAAQRVASPGLPFAYFPDLAGLPLPRAPP